MEISDLITKVSDGPGEEDPAAERREQPSHFHRTGRKG